MSHQTGAQIIGTALARAGATHAFGIPGGEVLALLEGLDGAGIDTPAVTLAVAKKAGTNAVVMVRELDELAKLDIPRLEGVDYDPDAPVAGLLDGGRQPDHGRDPCAAG